MHARQWDDGLGPADHGGLAFTTALLSSGVGPSTTGNPRIMPLLAGIDRGCHGLQLQSLNGSGSRPQSRAPRRTVRPGKRRKK